MECNAQNVKKHLWNSTEFLVLNIFKAKSISGIFLFSYVHPMYDLLSAYFFKKSLKKIIAKSEKVNECVLYLR